MADNGQGSQAGRDRNPQDPRRDRLNQPQEPGQGAGQNNNQNPNDNNRDPNNRDGGTVNRTYILDSRYFESSERRRVVLILINKKNH